MKCLGCSNLLCYTISLNSKGNKQLWPHWNFHIKVEKYNLASTKLNFPKNRNGACKHFPLHIRNVHHIIKENWQVTNILQTEVVFSVDTFTYVHLHWYLAIALLLYEHVVQIHHILHACMKYAAYINIFIFLIFSVIMDHKVTKK